VNEQRAHLITEAQSLMGAVEAEKRSLTAEESEKLDRILADVDALDAAAKQAERSAKVAELGKSLDAPVRRIATAARAAAKHSDDEYRAAFRHYLMTGQGSAELRTMTTATNNIGGYVVPETLENRIVEQLYQSDVMRQLATVRSTPDDRKIAVESTLGTATWVGEGSAITQTDVQFAQVTVGAWKAATSVQVNRELMDDAVFDLESYLVDKLTLRIGRLQEEAYVVGAGSGSSQPNGVLTGLSAGYTVANGTSQTLKLTDAKLVFDWLHALEPQYRAGAVILCHDNFIKQLRQLQDSNGQFLWQPSMQQGVPGSLCGIPVYTSEYHTKPGGTNGSTAAQVVATYGLFRYFEIYDRGQTEMLVDPYTNSLNWRVNIHVVRRTDSVRTLDAAFKTLKLAAS